MNKPREKMFNCGKCNDGKIKTSSLLTDDGVEVFIAKCSLCSQQYIEPDKVYKLKEIKP